MNQYLSHKIALMLCEHGIIKENIEIYEYGFTLLLPYLIECLLVILISLYIDTVLSSFTYIYLFTETRKYTGGYHANTYVGCIILFVLLYLILIWTKVNIPFSVIAILSIIAELGLMVLSPVDRPNKNKYFINEIKCKTSLKNFFAIELIILFPLFVFNIELAKSILLTNIIVFILAILQVVINVERRKKNDWIN